MNKLRAFIIIMLICVSLITFSFSVLAANKLRGQAAKIQPNLSITVAPATWTENCNEIVTIYGRLTKLRPTRGIPGKFISIKRKRASGWVSFRTVRTNSEGKYSFRVAVDDIKDQMENQFKAIFRGDRKYKYAQDQSETNWSGNPPCPESN